MYQPEIKPSEVLKKYDICQHMNAQNAIGHEVDYDSQWATRFCMLGAIGKAYPNDDEARDFYATKLYSQIYGTELDPEGEPEYTDEGYNDLTHYISEYNDDAMWDEYDEDGRPILNRLKERAIELFEKTEIEMGIE